MRHSTFALGRRGVLALAAIGLLVAGCGDDDPGAGRTTAPAPTAAALADRTFVAHGGPDTGVLADTTLVLTFASGALTANAGCNTLRGPYAVQEGTLRWTAEPVSTMKACGPPRDAQDRRLRDLLTAGVEAGLVDGRLTLTRDGTTIALKEGVDPSAPPRLRGTTWTLLSATDPQDQVIDVSPGGADEGTADPPTLRIGADDVAAVFTGCNRGSAPVKVGDDGFLEFGPLALTRMACEGTAAELETAVKAVLDGRAAFGFGDPPLTIAKDGRRLDFAPGP